MDWFSRQFVGEGESQLESRLVSSYTAMIQQMMGMGAVEARDFAAQLIAQAKSESQAQGGDRLPTNFGDVILVRASTDVSLHEMLARKRREGVRDEDIRWWWNMHDLERRVMLNVDEYFRFALFKFKKDAGCTGDEAASIVKKCHPIFGEADDTQAQPDNDDQALPYELKDRINRYIERRSGTDPEEFKAEIERASSYNAFVRQKVRSGEL